MPHTRRCGDRRRKGGTSFCYARDPIAVGNSRQQDSGTHKMVAVVDLDRDHRVVASVPEEPKDFVITSSNTAFRKTGNFHFQFFLGFVLSHELRRSSNVTEIRLVLCV